MTPLRVLFIPHASGAVEEQAAWSWLEDTPSVRARRTPATDLQSVAGFKPHVIWVHATSRAAGRDPDLARLKALAQRGRFLLTGGAATLPVAFGLEPEPPNEVSRRSWPDGAIRPPAGAAAPPDAPVGRSNGAPLLGHATLHGHPLFDGLGSSACTWRPRAGEEYTVVAYRAPAWPMNARVIAVERGGREINPDRATIWEYTPDDDAPDAPRTLCIGAYLPFTSSDAGVRPCLEHLARNALFYAAGRPAAEDAPDGDRIVLGWRPRAPRPQQEAALRIPEPPPLADPLPPFESPLRSAGASAADAALTLAGRRTAIIGTETRGIDELWVHPVRVLRDLRLDGAEIGEVEVTPAGVRRSLNVRGRRVDERIFVPRDAAAAIVEWTVDPEADGDDSPSEPVDLRLSWTAELRLAPPYPSGSLGALRWRREDRALLVRSEPSQDRVLYALSQSPARWSVAVVDADAGGSDSAEQAPVIRSEVSVRVKPGEGVRLAVAGAADEDGLDRVLDRLRRPPVLVRARAAASRRRRARGLALDADDARAGAAVRWARYRLAALTAEARGVGPTLITRYGAPGDRQGAGSDGGRPCSNTVDAAWAAHACLCIGDAETPREVLRFLGRHQDPSGRPPSGSTLSALTHYDGADAIPAYLLLTARYAAWTGDLGFIAEEWPRIERAVSVWTADDADGRAAAVETGIAGAALSELADIADSLGRTGDAEELREQAGAGPGDPATLAHGSGSGSWAAFAAGRADAGYRLWSERAARGLERHGVWSDPAEPGGPDDALATAMVIVPLVYGLLGVRPDAPQGRLRVRPQVPRTWDRLRIERLRMGDTELALHYAREGATHTFRLEQTGGAVPMRVVFEPALPGRRVGRASVDGRAAVLDPRTFGERVLVPLQVVLDHERTIELETTD